VRRSLLFSAAFLVAPLAGLAATAPAASASAAAPAAKAGASHQIVWPKVSGGFGQVPTITFPSGKMPTTLGAKVLHEGNGPVTKKGDLLVANYLGQIWKGKVFDSSFARHQLSGFGIGVGQVIAGWDKTLVGVHAGSRLLLVIPPVDGYGPKGNVQAGITGKDTLVFVVDVVASYSRTAEADPHAKVLRRTVGGITVSGGLGGPPTIQVKKGTPEPTTVKTTVLARGQGKPLKAGLVVVQFAAASWGGVLAESTWAAGTPYAINLGLKGSSSFVNALEGTPVGSRVLIELPKSGTSGGGPYAMVMDIVAQPNDPQH
jgi:peptidylprolyl isomerase